MLGTAYVRGLENAGVTATLKHFAGYSASRARATTHRCRSGSARRRDAVLPTFEMAVAGGRGGVGDERLLRFDGVAGGGGPRV